MCHRYAGRAITGEMKATSDEAIIAEADLPTVTIKATQLSTIATEKSLRMLDAIQRRQIVTAQVLLRTKKSSLMKKASDVWRLILETTLPEWIPELLHPRLQTGNYVFEVDGVT